MTSNPGLYRISLFTALLAGQASNCGPAEPTVTSIAVHVPSVPPQTMSLNVSATLDGKKAMQNLRILDSQQFDYFGIRLPKEQQGTLMVNVDILDIKKCKLGSASASTALGPPYQFDITVDEMLLTNPSCPSPPPLTCGEGLFCWSNTSVQGNRIKDLIAINDNDIWAVGEAGSLLHYNGTSWGIVFSGISDNLNAIWAANTNDVFAVGDSGRIVYWDGNSVQIQNSNSSMSLYGIWGSGLGDIYAVGAQGQVIHYDGNVWSASKMISSNTLNSIWGSDRNHIYAAGDNGTIVNYDGMNWSSMPVPSTVTNTSFHGVDGSGSTIFAVGDNGKIISLNGTSWVEIPSSISSHLNAVFVRSAADAWAVGNGGARIRFNGTVWSDISNSKSDGVSGNLLAVSGSQGTIWAGGDGGALTKYSIGPTWNATVSGTADSLRSVYGFTATNVCAVGSNGLLLWYDGLTWKSPMSSPIISQQLNSIWGSKASGIWAAGDMKTLLKSTDGCKTWSSLSVGSPNIVNLLGIGGISENDFYVVGTPQVAMGNHYLNYTTTMEIDYSVPASFAPLNSVWSVGGYVYAGGDNQIVRLKDLPAQKTTVPNTVRAIWGSSSTDWWVVGDKGLIMHGTGPDGHSLSWDALPPITTNNLNGLWGFSIGDIWAVGEQGTVLHYNGTQWELMQSGTKNTLRSIWGMNSKDLWVTGDYGTILHKQN